MSKCVRKAIIPAAGFGTRMLPATKAVPKELLPIVNKPLIQFAVEEAVAAGIEEILIITSRGKGTIEDHFDIAPELEAALLAGGKDHLVEVARPVSSDVKISYLRQGTIGGLGHAILQAAEFVGDELAGVLLPDDLLPNGSEVLRSLIDIAERTGASVNAARRVPIQEIGGYGCLDGEFLEERLLSVKRIVEKPEPDQAPSDVAVMGRYVLTPDVFAALARTKPGKFGELHLTDAQAMLLDEGTPLYGWVFAQERFDVGNPLGYLCASVAEGLRRPDIRDQFLVFLTQVMAQ